eukprot:5138111-Alexandrium_andersonii.AAC.1
MEGFERGQIESEGVDQRGEEDSDSSDMSQLRHAARTLDEREHARAEQVSSHTGAPVTPPTRTHLKRNRSGRDRGDEPTPKRQ